MGVFLLFVNIFATRCNTIFMVKTINSSASFLFAALCSLSLTAVVLIVIDLNTDWQQR